MGLISLFSVGLVSFFFFFSSRRRHTRWPRDWSSDVCSSDLASCSWSTTSTTSSLACAATVSNSWARSRSTRTSTGSASCVAPRASSSGCPSSSAECAAGGGPALLPCAIWGQCARLPTHYVFAAIPLGGLTRSDGPCRVHAGGGVSYVCVTATGLRPLRQRARPLADLLARRPKALLAGQREDRDRQAEPLVQLVEQSPLLPAGVVGRTKRDEDVICWKAGQRIRKREHRIVGPNYSACFGSQLLKLTENRLKSLIGLLARFVGGGSQPFKPRCKSGGNDDDLVSCVNEFTDTERQLLRSACRLSGRHQESRRHSATS